MLKTYSIRDFSGGYVTSVDEALLQPTQTASLANVDLLDSKAIRRRNGYTAITGTISDQPVRGLYRYYQRDGGKYWLCVAATGLYQQEQVSGGSVPFTRIEAETVADGVNWYTSTSAEYSGGVAAVALIEDGGWVSATLSMAVPYCNRLRLCLADQGIPAEHHVTASIWVGASQFSVVVASGGRSAESDPIVWAKSISASAYDVSLVYHVTGTYSTSVTRIGVDYVDYALVASFVAADSSISASGGSVAFATYNDKAYYATAYDNIRSFDGSVTATVYANGVSGTLAPCAAFLVEVNRRLFCAGRSDDPSLLEYSALDNAESWVVNATDDGGAMRVMGKDSGGECTGLAVWKRRLYYFAPSRIHELTVAGDPTTWTNYPISTSYGTYAPKSIATAPNGVVFFASDKSVKIFGVDGDFTDEPAFVTISDAIAPTLRTISDAMIPSVAGAIWNDRYWLSCSLGGEVNDTVFVYRFPTAELPGAWTKYTGMGIGSFHVTRGDEPGLYGAESIGSAYVTVESDGIASGTYLVTADENASGGAIADITIGATFTVPPTRAIRMYGVQDATYLNYTNASVSVDGGAYTSITATRGIGVAWEATGLDYAPHDVHVQLAATLTRRAFVDYFSVLTPDDSTGHIYKLDTGDTDNGEAITMTYVIPPVAPGSFDVVKHFKTLYLTADSQTTQGVTITPETDDVSGSAVAVTISPNTARQPVRVPMRARGRSIKTTLNSDGSAQPLTISAVTYSFHPKRIR